MFGTAMAVMGAMYQVNLLMAGLFQANANVPGVEAFPLEGIVARNRFRAGHAGAPTASRAEMT